MSAFGDSILGSASVFIAFMAPITNSLGVILLILPRQTGIRREIRVKVIHNLLTNPLMISIAAGISCSAMGIPIPAFVDQTLEILGRTAMPLALFTLGASLDLMHIKADIRALAAVITVKLFVYPFLLYVALGLAGLRGERLYVPVLLVACPTAVISLVFAKEMGGDERLAAAFVIGTTIASFFGVSLWLAFFQSGVQWF